MAFLWKNRVRVLYISGSLEDIFLLLIAMLLRQLFTKCIECHSQKDQAERGARTSSAQRPHGRRGTRGGVQRKVRCYIDWLKSWGKITVKVGLRILMTRHSAYLIISWPNEKHVLAVFLRYRNILRIKKHHFWGLF